MRMIYNFFSLSCFCFWGCKKKSVKKRKSFKWWIFEDEKRITNLQEVKIFTLLRMIFATSKIASENQMQKVRFYLWGRFCLHHQKRSCDFYFLRMILCTWFSLHENPFLASSVIWPVFHSYRSYDVRRNIYSVTVPTRMILFASSKILTDFLLHNGIFLHS